MQVISSDRAGPTRFHRGLERSGIRRVLDASLRVLPPDAQVGMSGAGLTIVNPPWQLDESLKELLPQLHGLLSPEGLGGSAFWSAAGRAATALIRPWSSRALIWA